jgi:ribose transport system permease protein
MNDPVQPGRPKEEATPRVSSLVRRLPTASGPMLGLIALFVLFVILLSTKGQLRNFVSLANVQQLLHVNAVTGVVALGMLLIIISGGIDLSVGSVVALATVATVKIYQWLFEASGGSTALASVGGVASGVGVGGLCGLTNGLAVTRLRVSPFVTTLGMLSIARGLAYWLAERTKISLGGDRPNWVESLRRSGSDYFLLDPGVWSAFLLAGFVAVLLHFTVFGRYCYAIGSNEATARLCGVNVGRTKLWIYTLAGLLTGWAGVLTFAQSVSGDPNIKTGLELEVIAAVVIGGASLSGGQGKVSGALLGVLILGVLENGVNFCGFPIELKYILIGGVVVVNTALSQWKGRGV